jgi:FlaA1/EpsC-like NDP-sugar epimerase
MKSFSFGRGGLLIGVWHAATIALSLTIAFLLRFDFQIPLPEIQHYLAGLWIALLVKMLAFYLTGLQRRWLWRFVDVVDLYRVVVGNAVASFGFAVAAMVLVRPGFPRSVYGIDFLICLLLMAGTRFAGRLYNEAVLGARPKTGGRGILIYGAGVAGTMLVRELRSSRRMNYKVIGFLDDDPNKRNALLLGVPVLGTGRDAVRIVDRYKRRDPKVEEIVIAMPSVAGRQGRIQEVLANCRAVGVPCKSVPSHEELLSGKVRIEEIRDLPVNDLLGRESVQLDETRLRSAIAGRAVLVTGAAGSIGSELCLQVSRLGPRKLIAFDQAESGLFMVELELRRKYPSLDLFVEIGDIRDVDRIDGVVGRHSVDLVFHAAAYKHVPMMESNPLQAVKTNILGTWNVVQAACRHRVSDFLMISTDKAVNPTSVMGVTKRAAELIVSAMPGHEAGGRIKFVSVRFGNVLGSSGSVVPILRGQIAKGGPVTVTHPEARRYFMTVGEAVQLVLEASMMGKGSEIFVLDMGEPIRIMDLARNMIRLSGLVPDEDIEIRVIGMRPGEKIYEELTTEAENVLPTYHSKIKVFQGPRLNFEVIAAWVAELETLVMQSDELGVLAHLKSLVPEYRPAEAASNSGANQRAYVPAVPSVLGELPSGRA